jgi:hypothetical protein
MSRGNLHRDPWFVPPSGACERELLQHGRCAERCRGYQDSRQVAGYSSDVALAAGLRAPDGWSGEALMMVLDDDRARLWRSPCCPIVLRCASDLRSRSIRAGARSAARLSLSLRQRCAPGAAGVSPKRRRVCGQHAASTSLWDASPVRGATLRCLSGLDASVPPIMPTGTIATPQLHPADIRQDKSRDVRPGRRAEKHGDISILAQCAFLPRDVRSRETSAKSTAAAHLMELDGAHRRLACNRVPFGYSVGQCVRG